MDLSERVSAWWRRRRALAELDRLGPEERGMVARDMGLPEDGLYRLAEAGGSGEDQLPRLMRALALDPEALWRQRPAVMRDMALICAGCTAGAHCRAALAAGTARAGYPGYCANALTLTMLRDGARRAA